MASRGLTGRRRMRRRLGTTVAVIVVAGSLLAGMWSSQRQMIYFPQPGVLLPPAAEVLPGARDVSLRTVDGLSLGAWFLPSRAPGTGMTVLVASGNAGDRSMRAPLAAALSEAGLAVLLFDYRGYGGNQGSPSEEGLALDVRAARRYLVQDVGVPPERMLYYGESLGAAVVTELATEHPPAGLLLRSPFTDLAAVARVHYPFLPVEALLWDQYALAERLSRIRVPTTVVYGSADGIVPTEQSRAVAAAAGGPAQLVEVPGADHNDRSLLNGPDLLRAVLELADRTRPQG